jgi:N-formylglutamate amidohydrolase|tara:strand:- start:3703 stop:4824 length:1122 start_codon:yes stop_codon:yes gene_type:complete
MTAPKKFSIRKLFEQISPILIDPKSSSITIGLSKRFLIFQILNKLTKKIEDDPHLNFISVLKNYKVLGKILDGTLYELHRDLNKLYFKNFFIDRNLYEHVKQDIEWVYHKCEKNKKLHEKIKKIKLTITKRGVLVYDNYQKNQFNVLLTTIHSGTWMRQDIQEKQSISRKKRLLEEDIDSHKIYSNLVLEKGGIWIDNKASRFACDYNRNPSRSIYSNKSEKWIKKIWKEELSENQKRWLMEGYYEFYFTLGRLIGTYRFNIIFDGHTMKHKRGRPEISFGTKYIANFYMPIVRSMQRKMCNLKYNPVSLNVPYSGGYILEWLSNQFPDVFICSMEVNKKLYMTRNRRKVIVKKLKEVSKNVTNIFDIEEDYS